MKGVTYDITGKLINEDNYAYVNENTCITTHTDYIKNSVKYSTNIVFKDHFGNITKRYLRTQYSPDHWIVLNYKIDYLADKK